MAIKINEKQRALLLASISTMRASITARGLGLPPMAGSVFRLLSDTGLADEMYQQLGDLFKLIEKAEIPRDEWDDDY